MTIFGWNTTPDGFMDRAAALSQGKAQLKQDIQEAMANTVKSIDELKTYHGKLATVFGHVQGI